MVFKTARICRCGTVIINTRNGWRSQNNRVVVLPALPRTPTTAKYRKMWSSGPVERDTGQELARTQLNPQK